MRHLIPPCVEHLHTRLVARVIPHRLWHVACLASLLVSCPLRRERQAEVEQGMVVARDVAHGDAALTGVDLAPVAAPLTLHAHRVGAPLGEAAGIESDDA